MGGKLETEQFGWLMELATQCFLAIREHMDEVLLLVELMLGTRFNCFKDNTIEALRARFVPERDVAGACDYFTRQVIFASWSKTSNLTTWFYDLFQMMQNDISY